MPTIKKYTRREALAAGDDAPSDAKVCVLTPEATEGPFYFDPSLVRSDITEGKQGAPLLLTLQIVDAKDCTAVPGARVDIWQADGLGLYSGYSDQEPVRQRVRLSYVARNSPVSVERSISPQFIPGGTQAALRIFISNFMWTTPV